jgi:CRISPR-associated exonuclease Cas4
MLDDTYELTITDLKQYAYCPRIFFYHACLPDIRPTTYKMTAGIVAGEEEKTRAKRRSLYAYDLPPDIEGIRRFDCPAKSNELNLTGIVDEVIDVEVPYPQLIPVDYKLSRRVGQHFKLQLAAYAELLEATYLLPVERGYLYLIPARKFEVVKITDNLRSTLRRLLDEMRKIQATEHMPPPAKYVRQCVNCEFRRYCNDVG